MSLFRHHFPAGILVLLILCLPAGGFAQATSTVLWPPPDIDRVVPPVSSDVSCPLDSVLNAASKRVQELVTNMQQISATELVEFSEVDRAGGLHSMAKVQFSYVADIHQVRPGQLAVDEYRNDTAGVQGFPTRLATTGTAAMALMFHPLYLTDFKAVCEGMSEMHGRRAWQMHLVQLRPNNFRGYRLANRYFPVMLKARAWIDAQSYEVLRLETDLAKNIPEIPLLLEHIVIDYGTVHFPRRKLQLWLPQTAEIYMDYRKHHYHHRHTFSGFQLFSVDTDERVKAPEGM